MDQRVEARIDQSKSLVKKLHGENAELAAKNAEHQAKIDMLMNPGKGTDGSLARSTLRRIALIGVAGLLARVQQRGA